MIDIMNNLGKQKLPFLFIIDFEKKNPIIIPFKSIDEKIIKYNINGIANYQLNKNNFKNKIIIKKKPISFNRYKEAFKLVQKNQYDGNSYLLNLTFPTEIKINLSLKEIFKYSAAKYKLYFKDKFTVFSPEIFIKIRNNKIYSYPMKGTIDADLPNAKNKILNNEKEFAEHLTIVDLIRNDLGIVAKNIKVEKFRYLEKIYTNEKHLYQVSSIISGELEKDYNCIIGYIIDSLLPAGSISGAPKNKTIEIIKKVENYNRGYYTGIFGYFDGTRLDSSVMIRFIEKAKDKLFYKSGGGVTIYSDVNLEYQELLDKIYVPIC